MEKRLGALIGVRVIVCILLIIVTAILYIYKFNEGASAFMTLATMAVTWMFKSRSDREVTNPNHQEVVDVSAN